MTVNINNVKIKEDNLEKLRLLSTMDSDEEVVSQMIWVLLEAYEKENGPISTKCTRDQLMDNVEIIED